MSLTPFISQSCTYLTNVKQLRYWCFDSHRLCSCIFYDLMILLFVVMTNLLQLLPTAFVSLTDPCLPPFWNHGYPAMAGLISMCAVFLVVTIEMTFSSINGEALGGCHGVHDLDGPEYQPIDETRENEIDVGELSERDGYKVNGNVGHRREGSMKSEGEELNSLIEIATMRRGQRHRRSGSIAESLRMLER